MSSKPGEPIEPGNGDLAARSEALDAAIEESPIDLKALVTAGDRHRRFIKYLAMSLAASFLLAVWATAMTYRLDQSLKVSNRALAQATKNAQTTHDACVGGNQFRADDKASWAKFFVVFAPPALSLPPETAAKIKEFEDFIDAKDAPKNCDVVAPVAPKKEEGGNR